MIRNCDRPQCFKELEDGYFFIECFDDVPYAYAAVALHPPTAMFHFEIMKWGHNTFRKFYADWQSFKEVMVKNDVTQIVITKEGLLADNKGYVKFLKKFGLPAPVQIMIATYELR